MIFVGHRYAVVGEPPRSLLVNMRLCVSPLFIVDGSAPYVCYKSGDMDTSLKS